MILDPKDPAALRGLAGNDSISETQARDVLSKCQELHDVDGVQRAAKTLVQIERRQADLAEEDIPLNERIAAVEQRIYSVQKSAIEATRLFGIGLSVVILLLCAVLFRLS